MLHLLFPQLADRLRAAVPALGTVDLDMAQLDYLDADQAIEYPAVYIDLEDITWGDLGEGIQSGRATFRVTVAVEVSELTHQADKQRTDAMERLELVQQVHQALNHWQGEGFGPLVRTGYRRDRPQHPEAWCLAMAYTCQLYDHDGAKQYAEVENVELRAQQGQRPAASIGKDEFVLPT